MIHSGGVHLIWQSHSYLQWHHEGDSRFLLKYTQYQLFSGFRLLNCVHTVGYIYSS